MIGVKLVALAILAQYAPGTSQPYGVPFDPNLPIYWPYPYTPPVMPYSWVVPVPPPPPPIYNPYQEDEE